MGRLPCIIWVGTVCHHKCPGKRGTDLMPTEEDLKAAWLQGQRLGWCSHKPGSAWACSRWRGQERSSPRALKRREPADLGFLTSDPQSMRETNFGCFKPQVCAHCCKDHRKLILCDSIDKTFWKGKTIGTENRSRIAEGVAGRVRLRVGTWGNWAERKVACSTRSPGKSKQDAWSVWRPQFWAICIFLSTRFLKKRFP